MLQVAVEDRPYPNLQKPTDAILKVSSTALCGSDLHFYRGHLKCPPDFICGHEFVGEIVEKGDSVKKFNIGDKVGEAVNRTEQCQAGFGRARREGTQVIALEKNVC